jgi:hypothetical protein
MIDPEPMGVAGAEQQAPTMVAIEVVLLWPQEVGKPVTVDEAGLWPVFVLVVGERRDLLTTSTKPLFDLLDTVKAPDEITVAVGRTRWTVVDPRHALLRLTVRADAPVQFEADILVPAERVLGVLDVVTRGATIGITTRRQAADLHDRVDVRTALRHVVLLSCPPSAELGELTQELCAAGR